MQAIRKQKDAVQSKQTYSKKPGPVWNETGKTACDAGEGGLLFWGKQRTKTVSVGG